MWYIHPSASRRYGWEQYTELSGCNSKCDAVKEKKTHIRAERFTDQTSYSELYTPIVNSPLKLLGGLQLETISTCQSFCPVSWIFLPCNHFCLSLLPSFLPPPPLFSPSISFILRYGSIDRFRKGVFGLSVWKTDCQMWEFQALSLKPSFTVKCGIGGFPFNWPTIWESTWKGVPLIPIFKRNN